MDISRKIMEILDDNSQQVPEGFYLEMCNQLKKLHVARPTSDELEKRELAVRRAKNRLNRQAGELNTLKEQLNKSIRDYNKCVEKFKEKKKKLFLPVGHKFVYIKLRYLFVCSCGGANI